MTSKEDSVKNTKVSRPKPPPTDKQRTKLAELAEECDIECPPVATRAEASEAIRELLAQKDANRHAAEAGEAWRYAPVAHQSSGRCLIHDLSWIGDCPECQREREQPERALADLTDEELLELFPGSTIQHVEKLEKAA